MNRAFEIAIRHEIVDCKDSRDVQAKLGCSYRTAQRLTEPHRKASKKQRDDQMQGLAETFYLSLPPQCVLEGNKINGAAALVKLAHCGKNYSVGLTTKINGLKNCLGYHVSIAVYQDRTEGGHFSVYVLGRASIFHCLHQSLSWPCPTPLVWFPG